MRRCCFVVAAVVTGCCPNKPVGELTIETYSGQVIEQYTCPGSSTILTVSVPTTNMTTQVSSENPGSPYVTPAFCDEAYLHPAVTGDTWTFMPPSDPMPVCTQHITDGQMVQVTGFGGTMTLTGADLQLNMTQTATIGTNAGCTGQVSGTLVEQPSLKRTTVIGVCQPG